MQTVDSQFESKWKALAEDLKMSPVKASAVLNIILKSYGEPHRAYHTLTHINDGLNVMQKLPFAFDRTQKFAYIFHDIVYDVSKTDNEEQSVKVAQDCLMENMCKEEFQLLKKYILATKHDYMSKMVAKDDSRVAYFLDVDLFSLGAYDYKDYVSLYAKKVAIEYVKFIGLEKYSKGRIVFLNNMLVHKQIYHSPYVKQILEKNALKNLGMELADLKRVKTDL